MKEYQLKAFTMIELLLVMVLSALIIGFCCLGYTMVQKNYIRFRSSAGHINESAKLQSVLSYDIDNCNYVSGDNKALLFLFAPDKVVKYSFFDKMVIRTDAAVSDTIHADIKNISLKYDQKPRTGTSDQIIDEILFECNLEGEEEKFNYFKLYPADVLMLHDPVEVNN